VDQQPISVEKEEEEDDLLALLHCISPWKSQNISPQHLPDSIDLFDAL
jgi:hypothetical protein